MIDHNITTEGEFFTSNSRYRINQKVTKINKKAKRISELNDADQTYLIKSRGIFIQSFERDWKDLVLEQTMGGGAVTDIAVALYIASYWSGSNQQKFQLHSQGYNIFNINFKTITNDQ